MLGIAVTLVTLVGHTAAGGGLPPVGPLLLLLPLAVALGAALADRRMSPAKVIAFVVGTQVLLHLLVTVACSHSGHGAGSATPAPADRMLLGHAIATVIIVAMLVHAETALHRWLRFLADLTRTWTLPALPVPVGARPVHLASVAPFASAEFRVSVQRRGPPSSH